MSPSPTPAYAGFELLERSSARSYNQLNGKSLLIPENGMPIPMLFQYDYTHPVCKIQGVSKSVAGAGCGATAASMVIAYINEDYGQTPYTLFYEAAARGEYWGNGLDYDSIQGMLSRRGIDARLCGVSASAIVDALQAQRPIILIMGPGTFTNEGHYIVLRGLNEEGRVLVNDPNSLGRSEGSYSPEQIAREAKRDQMLVIYSRPAVEAEQPTPEPTPEPTLRPAPQVQTDTRGSKSADAFQMPVAEDTPFWEGVDMPVAQDVPRS